MTRLISFVEGRFANIIMESGEPCWVSLMESTETNQISIIIKKSKIGFFGKRLFFLTTDYERMLLKATELKRQYPNDLTPSNMLNIWLESFANAVLHCKDTNDVKNTFSYINL